MENKILLACTILVMLFLVAVVSAASSNDILKQCSKECRENRDVAHHNCISVHKNESTKIREDYKICTKDIKNSFKNNTINKTDLNSGIKNCSKTYLNGLKTTDNKRKECFKLSDVNCEKKCKEQSCNETQKPVCGKDNVTYQNECQLKKADIKKSCDGQCPCPAECIKEGKTGITGKDKCCDGLKEVQINSAGSVSRMRCESINEDEKITKCVERSDICPALYNPVCGWFNSSVMCFKYPCATGYSNSCVACNDTKVDYWTPGKCPNNPGRCLKKGETGISGKDFCCPELNQETLQLQSVDSVPRIVCTEK